MNRLNVKFIFAIMLIALSALSGCVLINEGDQNIDKVFYDDLSSAVKDTVLHIKDFGKLPDQYITKPEALRKGWDPPSGNLQDVLPGRIIGGDTFYNREGRLPAKEGRGWIEADISYSGGHRGAERIVFSNDGLIFITEDHYETFKQVVWEET